VNRGRLGAAAVSAAAVLIVVLVTVDLLRPAAPPPVRVATALVRRGTVRVLATTTGTLVPVSQQNASFRQPGQLVEVDVRVGDRVSAGEVLARIDARPLHDALAQAQARLAQDQATLESTVSGNGVETARHSLGAAQTALDQTVAQVELTVQEDAATVLQDQRFAAVDQLQLRRDQAALGRDQSTLSRDQSRLGADLGALQQDQARLAAANAQLAADQGQLSRDQAAQSHDCSAAPAGPQCGADRGRVDQDQGRVSQDQREVALVQGQVNQDSARVQGDQQAVATDAPRVEQDQTLVAQDTQRVESDQAKLLSDQERGAADQVAGPRSVSQAQAALTSAQDALVQQTTNRTGTIAEEQAVVAGDQAQLSTARQNLEETVLTAPADGTVASVNGAVGESVTAGGGVTTPQAPGSVAPQPNASGASPAGSAGAVPATGGAASATAFIVLSDVHSLQMVTMVGERDAARLQPRQAAMVSLDAVPGMRLAAEVLAVAPNGTLLQNVTDYLATLTLQQVDRRLRAGMSAVAAVVVDELHDVVVVPNAAIDRAGAQSMVTVVQDDGTERRVAIRTGTAGDTTTEVLSGLRPGDRVLLPLPLPPARSQ
jgi:HlyD family secretion protein